MSSSVEESVKGGVWIFTGSFLTSVSGLVFWLILSWLVGVGAIGEVSKVISSAGIASSIISAGLNIAVMREVAERGPSAILPSILYSLVLGFTAAAISVFLARGLNLSLPLIIATIVYAIVGLASLTSLSILVGLEMFRAYAASLLAASIVKLLLGIILAILGLGLTAALVGYLSYPLAAVFTALLIIYAYIFREYVVIKHNYWRIIKRIFKLNVSNYPFAFSTQLLTLLSVYIFAYLVGSSVPTGTLYVTLMITLSITAVPTSILSAALPIGVRRSSNPYMESLRIGLALVTPIVVLLVVIPDKVLALINPELIMGSSALRVLLLSVTPLTVLTSAIMKLNKELRTREVALVGIVRLAVLIALLYTLTKGYGLLAASIAYLTSSIAALPLIINEVRHYLRYITLIWVLQIGLMIPSLFIINYKALYAITASVASIIIMHASNMFKFSEFIHVYKLIMSTILKK